MAGADGVGRRDPGRDPCEIDQASLMRNPQTRIFDFLLMFVNTELLQGFVEDDPKDPPCSVVFQELELSVQPSSSSFCLSSSFPDSLGEVNVTGQAWMRKLPPLKIQCGLEKLGEGRI